MMWFTDVRPIGLTDQVLSLAVPSQFVRERLQHNHLGLIEEAAEVASGGPVKIEMEVDEAIRHEEFAPVDLGSSPPAAYAAIGAPPAAPSTPTTGIARAPGAPGLPFPNYTFDAFVPGPSSRFAHAAAMAVAEAPLSTAYNPLFIYGHTGLGKTHLLVAIGHHIWRLMPETRIKYVTSEQFVTEFIKAYAREGRDRDDRCSLEKRSGDKFRDVYPRKFDGFRISEI